MSSALDDRGAPRVADVRVLDEIRARLVAEIDDPGPAVQRAVAEAERAVEALDDVDPDELDLASMRRWLEGIESVRRRVEAAAAGAVRRLDRSNPFREQGFFGARSVVRHLGNLSGPEAHGRVQIARLYEALPDWSDAAAEGTVGVAQTRLMARIAANPRLPAELLERDAPDLLHDAVSLPFDEFERRARTWEALADPDGDRRRNDADHAARRLRLRPRPNGGWTLSGSLPELAGAELNEILAWFNEAEWRDDWAAARNRHGDDVGVEHLTRTEPQRRADALVAMARIAAGAASGTVAGRPTVNVLIDDETFEAHLRGERRDPADYRDVVVRTQAGRRLHPDDAVNAALVGHVRRVVYDSSGTVVDLGRRSRLFRGAAREAVMLLATICAWIGCDRPVAWCDADHSRSWRAHGATVPRNGGPLCGAHNLLKERGFRVRRDAEGNWHTFDPDGNEIV